RSSTMPDASVSLAGSPFDGHEPHVYKIPLLDDLELIALVGALTGGAQQSAERTGGASLAADDFAHIVLGDFQFDHAIVELFDEDLIRRVDQLFRDQLKERT